MAVDKTLNIGIDSLKLLDYKAVNLKITDYAGLFPSDWSWKQGYEVPMEVDHKPKSILMVPFSEAGQMGGEIETWIGAN